MSHIIQKGIRTIIQKIFWSKQAGSITGGSFCNTRGHYCTSACCRLFLRSLNRKTCGLKMQDKNAEYAALLSADIIFSPPAFFCYGHELLKALFFWLAPTTDHRINKHYVYSAIKQIFELHTTVNIISKRDKEMYYAAISTYIRSSVVWKWKGSPWVLPSRWFLLPGKILVSVLIWEEFDVRDCSLLMVSYEKVSSYWCVNSTVYHEIKIQESAPSN